MSSYVFFMHKKKHRDVSVSSERWKTMSTKEKGKSEDMAKADKARYERDENVYSS